MTSEKDIVLLYFEDQPTGFARIEEIRPDWKKNWYHVKLLMLQVPVQVITWILRDVYIDGQEFTMNGVRVRLDKVICPPDEPAPDEDEHKETSSKTESDQTGGSGKIISFKKRDT